MRTQQRFEFLLEIVRDVAAGKLAPAAFQRPYVWTREDVVEMWESIVGGDPLGGLLLWRPDDASLVARWSRNSLGPIAHVADRHAALVLDGQNRLVSLAWSMTDPKNAPSDSPGYEVWMSDDQVLAADAASRTIRFMRPQDVVGLSTPIWSVFDNSKLQKHFRTAWDGNDEGLEVVKWLEGIATSIREAKVVVSTIEGGSPAEARARFLRMARAGVAMTPADFDALMTIDDELAAPAELQHHQNEEPTMSEEKQMATLDQWDDAGPFVYRILPESCLAAFFTEERDMIRITHEDGGWWLAQDGVMGQSRHDTLAQAKQAGDEIVEQAEATMDADLIKEAGLSQEDWKIVYRDGLTFEHEPRKASIIADTEPMSGEQKWDLYIDEEPPITGFKTVQEAVSALET